MQVPGFAPADEALLFRQNDPKPCWPWCGPLGSLRGSPIPAARKNSLRSNSARLFHGVACTARPHHKARRDGGNIEGTV